MISRHACRIALLLGLLAVIAPACSTSQAQNMRLLRQWNAKCKEAADLMEKIQDVPSAKAVEPKLKLVMQELHKLDEKLEASYIPEEVDFEDAPRMASLAAEGIGPMQQVMVESLRIGKDPEMRAALGDTWQLLPAAAMMDAHGNLPPTE